MSAAKTSEVLIINCGSSSLKFAWLNSGSGAVLASGLAERLGTNEASLLLRRDKDTFKMSLPGLEHGDALRRFVEECWPSGVPTSVQVVGHRVVHGGDFFRDACLVNDDVLKKIEACIDLAPLHNPSNLVGIRVAMQHFPSLPQVVVFDTAFHQTMPERAYRYAVPDAWFAQHRARRYGFHGTSHQFVSGEAARLLGRPLDNSQLIVAHLGNGCSVCAVKNGLSVDTSMGLTPLEGLVMGTRSGDVDPNLAVFIAEKLGQSIHDVIDTLNRKSGLLGLSGLSNDMRTLVEAARDGHAGAALAIEVFCYRLARQILAMAAGLDRIDALVFTGGIGEHSTEVRAKTLNFLAILRPQLDDALNADHGRAASGAITRVGETGLTALVVPTNEEWMIGRIASRLVGNS